MGQVITTKPPTAIVGEPTDVSAPGPGQPAAVVYPAGKAHGITGVAWSYDAAPLPPGRLQVADGPDIIFAVDVTAPGPGVVYFSPAKVGTAGREMSISLSAGGAACAGKVSVLGHFAG